jgi:DNA-binding Lrp family transcriptional regulator
MRSTASLDQFDIKILVHLQRAGRCSNVELAAAVGLSESPCLARTKRLQEIGVIRGYGADVALEKLGDHLIVFCEVTIGNHRLSDFARFEAGAGRYPEIVECYNVSGGYDYLLKIVVPGMGHFHALMERLRDDDIGIEKFVSRIVLRQPLGQRGYPVSLLVTGTPGWE